MDRQAKPVESHARKLIAAALALVVCRVASQWNSVVAGLAALIVILTLIASIIAGMPRVRRILLIGALPACTLANAVALGLGAFVMLLGMQGLLVYGRIGHQGPPWNITFAIVPLAAATNLVWLGRPISKSLWMRCVWLINLAAVGYSLWFWHEDEGFSAFAGLHLPGSSIALISLAILSMVTLAWDTGACACSASAGPYLRRLFVSASALLIFAAICWALFPTYRKRQIASSLDACGLGANFGIVFPGGKSPISVPVEWYDYLGEISGVAAPEAVKGDFSQAGRLLSSLPWLGFVIVNELPLGAERLLRPLAGHARLRQVALKGPGVTDETLADAALIPGLNRVVLERAQITDAGLANLANLPWLQVLAIRQTPISGDGLAGLRSLPRLSELDLSDTEIGDAQVSELPRFKALVKLSLANTRVTDESLASLLQCKTLKVIDLSGSRVTESGVERLRRALPRCDIVWQRGAEFEREPSGDTTGR